jgi:PP-loop superfamily ATP-utilizing enzyme
MLIHKLKNKIKEISQQLTVARREKKIHHIYFKRSGEKETMRHESIKMISSRHHSPWHQKV